MTVADDARTELIALIRDTFDEWWDVRAFKDEFSELAYERLLAHPDVVLRALGGSKVGEWTHPTPYSEWRFMEAKS